MQSQFLQVNKEAQWKQQFINAFICPSTISTSTCDSIQCSSSSNWSFSNYWFRYVVEEIQVKKSVVGAATVPAPVYLPVHGQTGNSVQVSGNSHNLCSFDRPPKLIIDRFKWLPFPQQEQVLHPPLALGVRFWIIAQLFTRCCIQYNTRQHLHLWKLGSNTSTPTMCHHLCIKCLLPTNLLFGQTRWDNFSAIAKSSYWPVCLILVEDFLFKVTSIILITIFD